jgi:hypothetical protein
MRRLLLPIVALVLFTTSASPDAGAQLTVTSCRRSRIECYPEDQKRPVLRYLDESREAADEFVRLLADQKGEEISSLHKGLSVIIAGEPNNMVDLATLERALGEVTHHEYRGQEIFYVFSDVIDLTRGRAATWYVVKSTKSEAGFATLQVTTRRLRNKTELRVDSVSFSEWAHRPIPTWLSDPSAPEQPCICSGMQDGLRVKAKAS